MCGRAKRIQNKRGSPVEALLALKGRALLAEIDQRGRNLLDVGIVKSGAGMYSDASILPPLPLHERTGGAQAAPGALLGNRLVQDEVNTQGKHLAHVVLLAGDRDHEGGGIARRGACAAERLNSLRLIFAIEDDRVVPSVIEGWRAPR